MKVKAKKCKGTGQATNSGCGKDVVKRIYGLCEPCYYDWLLNTEAGRIKLAKSTLQGKRKYEKKVEEEKKEQKRSLKILKKELKTHGEWLNDLQAVFNEFIRLRDKGQPCISCGKPYGTFTESAGHYFPRGGNGSIRFDEDNVHLQCWYNCNKNKHGNQAEYLPNLIKKIGQERYDALCEKRNKPIKLTKPEIQEKIKYYKQKTKELWQV